MDRLKPRTKHTPKCFEAALEVASENEDAVVVQAWIYNQTQWILHAWCEIGDHVIDLMESRSPIPKIDYYAVMGVTETRARRYSRLTYFTMAAESGHFGPFDNILFFAGTASEDPLEHIPREQKEIAYDQKK